MKLYSLENQLISIIFLCLFGVWEGGGVDVVHGGSFLFDLAPITLLKKNHHPKD